MTDPGDTRVSTLELFFDLVFVFTITQVALVVEHRASWSSVAQALLELAVIYWMYGGYAWLTNTLGSRTPRQRIVLLLGMAAFFVVSLSVPGAFGDDGIAFGWAYLGLNALHLSGFLIGGVPSAAAAIRRIAPYNLLAAVLVLVAGYTGAPAHWVLWVTAVLVQWAPALLTRTAHAFAIDVDHWAERHGLMIIIALGESLVSVAAASGRHVDASLVLGALAGLAASAAMWWSYFAGEDERAARAFGRLPPGRRGAVGLLGYDLPHVFMLAGVVAVAAGSRLSLPDLTATTSLAGAALIAGGAGVYVAALAGFRFALHSGAVPPRLGTAVALLATIPVGTDLGAAQQLLAVALVIVAMLLVERRADAGAAATQAHQAG